MPSSFKLRDGVIFQDLGTEALLLDTRSEEVFSFDPVARDIWLALQEHEDLDAALAEVLAHYDVDAKTLKRDALQFLEEVRKAKLLAE